MRQLQVRVAIIEPVGGHGGMDYYDFGLCAGLASAGVNVVLYTCDKTLIPKDAGFVVCHTYFGIYGDASSWLRGLRYLRGSFIALLSAVLENRKICHFHFFHVGVLETFNITLAKLFGRKIVITAHDIEPFVENLTIPRLLLWCFSVADGVIVHNRISKSELMEKALVPESKIAIIPHGNYLHMLRSVPTQQKARYKLGLAENAKVLLFFGQIKDIKGLDLLLQAMPLLLDKYPETVLVIAGKPWKSDFITYERIIEKLGIQEACITHIRFIPDEEVPIFYAACDLVVLPYRRIYQSGVILMTMSYCRPVLAANLLGMIEIITEGETGLLFKAGEANDLSLSLIQALGDMPRLASLAKNGYAMMENNFDWTAIGKITYEFYAKYKL